MNLRPHHLLCLNFFIGQGYNKEFIDNMTTIHSFLNNQDSLVTFSFKNDCLCKSCLNYQNGSCSTEEKVMSYDKKVIEILNLEIGKEYRYFEINKEVVDKILNKIRLKDICINCCWKDICYKLQKEKFLKD